MTNALLIFLLVVGSGLVGGIIGRSLDTLQRQVAELQKQLAEKKPEPVVTMGVYDRLDTANKVNTDAEVGLVEVKTPQRLSWEETERVRRETTEL